MNTLLPSLRRALVERWVNDSALTALVGGRVLDRLARQGETMPYLRLGSRTEVPSDMRTLDRGGWDVTVTADLFCGGLVDNAYVGFEEAETIVNAMHAAVLEPLLLEGFGMASLRPDGTAYLSEDDGKTIHVPVRYRMSALESP